MPPDLATLRIMGKRLAAVDANPNHMFISRHELTKLREVLGTIPGIAADLPVTIAKQARLGDMGRGRKPRRPSEQPLPFHVDAARVADELHNALVGWVRLVCEQRAMQYTPVGYLPAEFVGPPRPGQKRATADHIPSTAELAHWLERHIVSLAMTEGSETALTELGHLAEVAQNIVCPPPTPVTIDEAKYERARRRYLNAHGIVALARELGEEYRHLTPGRVKVLKRAGKITPVPGPWRPDWPTLYVLGEVLDAHLALPIRQRHAKAS